MRVGEKRVVCVGKWPVVLGRDADVSIRGTSVSRQHCELSLVGDGRIRIKDLASRNGTLLARVPIQSSLDVDSGVQLGLGDDVHAQLSLIPSATSNAIQVEVLDGPDRALVALLGEERMQLTGTRASIEFVNGRASLHAQDGASLRLAGIVTTMPIVLLRGDSIEVDGVRVEVSA
ncbi:MAG: FHA domain-containing protein [Sandaracinaceae bacterium]|nr:FHA domain-containing protein [Sandaracinaceae bacterium]